MMHQTTMKAAATLISRLTDILPARSQLAQYRPRSEWFLRPESLGSIHGINHEARVLVWQELLARLVMQDGQTLDTEALRWAAATHDTQRADDGIDALHGERAAAWVIQHMQGIIPANSLETVAYLNRWHAPGDASAPAMTPELAVFKDADGLDRVRIYDLNPRYLRLEHSRALLLPLAQPLLFASKRHQFRGAGLFDCVLAGALELGIITDE